MYSSVFSWNRCICRMRLFSSVSFYLTSLPLPRVFFYVIMHWLFPSLSWSLVTTWVHRLISHLLIFRLSLVLLFIFTLFPSCNFRHSFPYIVSKTFDSLSAWRSWIMSGLIDEQVRRYKHTQVHKHVDYILCRNLQTMSQIPLFPSLIFLLFDGVNE